MKPFWQSFDSVLKWLANAGMVLLFLMMVSVCWEVFSRYFLGKGTTWVIEFSEYTILFMTFLGTAWLLKEDGHVEMDIVVNRLSSGKQRILQAGSSITCTLVCLALAWSGADVALDHLQRGLHQPTLVAPPDFPLFAVIPTGFLLLAVQFARRARNVITDKSASPPKVRALV